MVQDYQEQLDRMRLIIESAGEDYNFFGATTAQEGLTLVKEKKMDLIILDINLPEQSGIELARKIREVPGYEYVWIIVLTGQRMHLNKVFNIINDNNNFSRIYDSRDIPQIIELLCGYQIKPVYEDSIEYIIFKQHGIYVKVLARDILYVEVLKNKSMLYTNSQKIVLPLVS